MCKDYNAQQLKKLESRVHSFRSSGEKYAYSITERRQKQCNFNLRALNHYFYVGYIICGDGWSCIKENNLTK